jgi:hypothetical protein
MFIFFSLNFGEKKGGRVGNENRKKRGKRKVEDVFRDFTLVKGIS